MSHAPTILRTANTACAARIANPTVANILQSRTFVCTARVMAATVDSDFISRIAAAEKECTKKIRVSPEGPTEAAQAYINLPLSGAVIHDIVLAEFKLTGRDTPLPSGPISIARSIFNASGAGDESALDLIDGTKLCRLAQYTPRVQEVYINKHAPTEPIELHTRRQDGGDPIAIDALHSITEGEKNTKG